jgi:hypothetical protein
MPTYLIAHRVPGYHVLKRFLGLCRGPLPSGSAKRDPFGRILTWIFAIMLVPSTATPFSIHNTMHMRLPDDYLPTLLNFPQDDWDASAAQDPHLFSMIRTLAKRIWPRSEVTSLCQEESPAFSGINCSRSMKSPPSSNASHSCCTPSWIRRAVGRWLGAASRQWPWAA